MLRTLKPNRRSSGLVVEKGQSDITHDEAGFDVVNIVDTADSTKCRRWMKNLKPRRCGKTRCGRQVLPLSGSVEDGRQSGRGNRLDSDHHRFHASAMAMGGANTCIAKNRLLTVFGKPAC